MMTTLPVIDLSRFDGTEQERSETLYALAQAAATNGFFYIRNHGIPEQLTREVLEAANRFFDLDASAKDQVHIRHSAHFRGYSIMKNERDWREQIHVGQELPVSSIQYPASSIQHPAYHQLTGPNLWPEALGDHFKNPVLEFMQAANKVGNRLLEAFATLLGLPQSHFNDISQEPPYLLLKLICYYAQPLHDIDRPGVAPHCDWSWLTILLQDSAGLEVLAPEGVWVSAPPQPSMLSVNIGELLEIVSKGRFVATAHQVVNPSEQKRRISVPVFINPALDARIESVQNKDIQNPLDEQFHVHRVLPRGVYPAVVHFGESEWQRKGLGQWCFDTQCIQAK
ncbi:MAG: isopenicillin N synthase family oxygenase [Saprospiraceae bacterium]|nr:isopenicillin N synthase family oxygenase [Saprospiraceae bacterium]